jgi:hypothetical protein
MITHDNGLLRVQKHVTVVREFYNPEYFRNSLAFHELSPVNYIER